MIKIHLIMINIFRIWKVLLCHVWNSDQLKIILIILSIIFWHFSINLGILIGSGASSVFPKDTWELESILNMFSDGLPSILTFFVHLLCMIVLISVYV